MDKNLRILMPARAMCSASVVDRVALEVRFMYDPTLSPKLNVCWVLENANTHLLTKDFAGALRSSFQVVSTKTPE